MSGELKPGCSTDTHYWDPGTNDHFSFNEEGWFVDSQGNKPRGGVFKGTNVYSDWFHDFVERKLQSRGLIRKLVPDVEGGAPIYHTPGALNNPDKLLVLICGSGRIKVGVWSVGVAAWHGLGAGSVLPMLDEAERRGMEVIVLNPNHEASRYITEFKHYGMVNHTLWVFKHLILEANPQNVYIVCHSAGGGCTCSSIETFPDFFKERVRAIAMTDACTYPLRDKELREWCFPRCINWVQSKEELNKEIGLDYSRICMMRSANTNDHPLTTHKAFPFIWEFFDEKQNEQDGKKSSSDDQ